MSVDIRDLKNLVFLPAYDPADDEDGFEIGDYDRHALNRLRLMCQLQYSRSDEDEALIRFVFEQEIIARERGVLGGMGETLEIGAFLLARFRRPADAQLFVRAKTADFDTGCGFDAGYVPWVLGTKSLKYLEAQHPELAQLWVRLGPFHVPESLDDWWASREKWFPDTVEKDDPLAVADRALDLGDIDRARTYVSVWAGDEPDSAGKWQTLSRWHSRFGDRKRAAEFFSLFKKESEPRDDWTLASTLHQNALLWHEADEQAEALANLRALDEVFSRYDGWRRVNLGRFAARDAFRVASAHPELEAAKEAFELGWRWYEACSSLWLEGLEAGRRAALRCGEDEREEELRVLVLAEQKRVDSSLPS